MLVDEKKIFIVWGMSRIPRRAETLSREVFKSKLFCLGYRFGKSPIFRPFEYVIKIFHTFLLLYKENPSFIIAQSGPSYCPFIVAIYSLIFKKKFIIDAHTSAITGFWFSLPSFKWTLSRSKMLLVHNDIIKDFAEKRKVKSFTLEDKLIEFKDLKIIKKPINDMGSFAVLPSGVMNSRSSSIRSIINAARKLENNNIHFYFTGNVTKIKIDVSDNVHFTGFLPKEDFFNLLMSVDALIILLDRKDKDFVQPARAIEGLSLCKPMILSDTSVARGLFPKGVIYVDNNSDEMVNGCIHLLKNLEMYNKDIQFTKQNFVKNWEKHFKIVMQYLNR